MRYKVEEEYFDDINSVLEYCIAEEYHYDDDYFEEWVNDNWGSISIDGYDYYAYDILDRAGDLDNVRGTFMEHMNEGDWEEAEYALNRAQPGDEVDCQCYTIEVLEDEPEEETGDHDGDDKLEMTRRFIEEQKLIQESMEEEDKKHETDFMELFQVITNE